MVVFRSVSVTILKRVAMNLKNKAYIGVFGGRAEECNCVITF